MAEEVPSLTAGQPSPGRRGSARPRANVLGVGVDAVNMASAVARILGVADARGGGYVCVTGVHGVMESQRDESLRAVHNASILTSPDGMPTVWVGRAQGHREMRRVYGPDLMLQVCQQSVSRDHTHYLYGGGVGVAVALAAALETRLPGIRILGTETPPFRPLTEAEESELAERLRRLDPTYLWVGLSTPKQERFSARMSGLVPRTLFLGVGAAFDMNAGLLAQAPPWLQRLGLEWLFRLVAEPRRLWRRYLRNNPEFIGRLILQFVSRGRSVRRID